MALTEKQYPARAREFGLNGPFSRQLEEVLNLDSNNNNRPTFEHVLTTINVCYMFGLSGFETPEDVATQFTMIRKLAQRHRKDPVYAKLIDAFSALAKAIGASSEQDPEFAAKLLDAGKQYWAATTATRLLEQPPGFGKIFVSQLRSEAEKIADEQNADEAFRCLITTIEQIAVVDIIDDPEIIEVNKRTLDKLGGKVKERSFWHLFDNKGSEDTRTFSLFDNSISGITKKVEEKRLTLKSFGGNAKERESLISEVVDGFKLDCDEKFRSFLIGSFITWIRQYGNFTANEQLEALEQLGLREHDAKIIVTLAQKVQVAEGPSSWLDRVSFLIQSRDLGEARAVLNAVPESLETEELTNQRASLHVHLKGLEDFIADKVLEAEKALSSGNFIAAQLAIDKIANTWSNHPKLGALFNRIPPGAPVHVKASVSPGDVCDISWESGSNFTGSATVKIVRKVGSAPMSIQDGDVVAVGVTNKHVVDESIPFGVKVFYGIAATNDGRTYSPLELASIVIVPPVRKLRWFGNEDQVTVEFERPRDADLVEVVCEGQNYMKKVQVRQGNSTTFTGLALGVRYTVTATAFYGDAKSTSAAIHVQARGKVKEIEKFTVVEGPDRSNGNQVTVEWSATGGYDVEFYAFPTATLFEKGNRVSERQLCVSGVKIQPQLQVNGTGNRASFAVPPQARYVTVIVVAPDTRIVGPSLRLGTTPSFEAPHVQRRGSRIVVSWVWPKEVEYVDARWTANGVVETTRMTRTQYLHRGGLGIRPAPDTNIIEIQPVIVDQEGEWPGTVTQVSVSRQPKKVYYELTPRISGFINRRRLSGLKVEFFPRDFVTDFETEVVFVAGLDFPPTKADSANGFEVLRKKYRFAPEQFTVDDLDSLNWELPGYLVLFATDSDIELRPRGPHTNRMKR